MFLSSNTFFLSVFSNLQKFFVGVSMTVIPTRLVRRYVQTYNMPIRYQNGSMIKNIPMN